MSDHKTIEEIEKKIYTTFAEVASSIGFSSLHGKIIGALLVGGSSLSLQDLARKTGYSSSMVSLSLDFLEVLGVIKKVKKSADRKLYIQLNSNLLESLKNILLIRLNKNISDSLQEFEDSKKKLETLEGKNKKEVLKAIEILEKEIKRLESYIKILSRINLPKVYK
jgi:DNA-binding transcriptional regulator GbsR (MarR family)